MSPAHCCAVQMAFDRIVEQPTERSPAATCDCKQARMRPPPGLMPAHRDWISVVQSRSVANNPSCAPAPQEPVNSNAAPSPTIVIVVFIMASPFQWLTNTRLSQYLPVIFVFLYEFRVDESNRVGSRRSAKLGREITVPSHKETSRLYASLECQKDVHRHLVREASIKTRTAHEPWRRMCGFHLNRLRR